MASLTRQAVIVSLSRFLNQGLMVISPIVLVGIMSVQDFGIYREFLMYATVVGNLAAFSLASSLLYFIGRQPAAAWAYVGRIVLAVAVSSGIACIAFAAVDLLWPGRLIGDALLPCLLYVLFYTNVDFWESLWLAQKRPNAVLLYSSGRLIARIAVVISVAALSDDVHKMFWALVALEGVRLLLSVWFWRRLSAREQSVPAESSWAALLEFCVPSGIAVFVTTVNSSLGGMFLAQSMGESALAMFVVGGYVLMVVYPLRNSVSDVLLPEMSRLAARERHGWLPLFRRSILLFSILLVPVAIVLGRFAEVFLTTIFSERYMAAVPIFQLHCVLLLLSTIDIAVVLRATNRTRSMLFANFIVVAINLLALWWLVPRYGGIGAGVALVLSTVGGMGYLLWLLGRIEGLTFRELMPLGGVARISAAAIVALPVLVPDFWLDMWGVFGAAAAGVCYTIVFVAGLWLFKIEEVKFLIDMIRRRFSGEAALRLPGDSQ